MSRPRLLLFLLFLTLPARAEWTRVLLPVWFEGEVAGAYGSRWTVELTGHNAANTQHLLTATPDLSFETPSRCGCTVGPGELFDGARFIPDERQGVGRFLYVLTNGPDQTDLLTLSLRTRDISREAEGFGTEVPVVREGDTVAGGRSIALTNIPMGPRYRQKLRLYDFAGGAGRAVTVEIHPALGNTLLAPLAIRTLHLLGAPDTPGYAELDLDTLPELAGAGRVSVQVKTLPGDGRYWAFVSVTNNITQQVTLVTP